MSLRRSIREPIPEILIACQNLTTAADAHIAGDFSRAERYFRLANCQTVWNWLNPDWRRPHLHVKQKAPIGDSRKIPKDQRDPDRNIRPDVRQAVLARDGYRCRYCGLPVISADIRKLAQRLYPSAVPWVERIHEQQHAGFQCLWLQYDHVLPHSHGGQSTVDNVVISCAMCNYAKDCYTLAQLELQDPRLFPPEPIEWDGLERLRPYIAAMPKKSTKAAGVTSPPKAPMVIPTNAPLEKELAMQSKKVQNLSSDSDDRNYFFLPGARISKGFVYTPSILGKERWFELGDQIAATSATISGDSGVIMICSAEQFSRRGIDAQSYDLRAACME